MVYAIIGGLAGLENIFPPVPADTAVALGAFLSNWGRITALGVFAVTWSVNVTTATAMYVLARRYGRPFFVSPMGRRMLRPGALLRLEQLYDRYGIWGIFLSRFIPAVRAIVPPFAGVARLDAWRAIVPMALASGIWYGTLTVVVVQLAQHLGDVRRLVGRINLVAAIAAAALAAIAVAIVVWRAREH